MDCKEAAAMTIEELRAAEAEARDVLVDVAFNTGPGGDMEQALDAYAVAVRATVDGEVEVLVAGAEIALFFTENDYCSSCGERWFVTQEMGACRLHPLHAALQLFLARRRGVR